MVGQYPELLYAGSCHDNINSWATGHYAPAIDPPKAPYQFELKELGDRKNAARTTEQFVPLLRDYEDLFARISKGDNKCWIGPPYDVATWDKGAGGWTINFKAECRPRRSAAKVR
jgi:hypothetical protein